MSAFGSTARSREVWHSPTEIATTNHCLDIAEASLDVEALRQEFPTLERWTYLDIARKAPLPRCVEAATRAFFEDIYEDAGRRAFSTEAVDETRAALADLLGVPA